MRISVFGAALVMGLLLSGCSLPALNFTPAAVPQTVIRHDAALISTTVTVASPQEATGKLNTAGVEADVASLWKSNLEDVLLRMALFQDNSPTKVSLVVKILELDLRSLGFKTRTTARYELIDRNTGKTLYTTDVQTEEGASDYVGDIRVRKSASRSVQANIEEFLRRIATAEIKAR